jgi:hypothetical protein
MSKGTPRNPKIPTLIANDTGTMAGPDIDSAKNQCDSSTPGTMNKKSVTKKEIRGTSAKVDRKGPIRVKATVLRSTI